MREKRYYEGGRFEKRKRKWSMRNCSEREGRGERETERDRERER